MYLNIKNLIPTQMFKTPMKTKTTKKWILTLYLRLIVLEFQTFLINNFTLLIIIITIIIL